MPTRIVLCPECKTLQKNKTQCGICGYRVQVLVDQKKERWAEEVEALKEHTQRIKYTKDWLDA